MIPSRECSGPSVAWWEGRVKGERRGMEGRAATVDWLEGQGWGKTRTGGGEEARDNRLILAHGTLLFFGNAEGDS